MLSWPHSALKELAQRPQGQLASLDGLRALAVLLVICDHWRFEWVTTSSRVPPLVAKLPVFHWGWTGVDLFFVLSGFFIGKQLWAELRRTGTIRVGAFVLRRGLRIWPLYYTMLLVFLLAGSVHAPKLPDWFMFSNYVPTLYARSWSLATEEQFYLTVPLLMLAISRYVPPRYWAAAVVALMPLVSAMRALTFSQLSSTGRFDGPGISTMMYAPFHLHCEPLLVGLSIAWVAQNRPAWLGSVPGLLMPRRVLLVAVGLAVLGLALRTFDRVVFAYLALGFVYGGAVVIALVDGSCITSILRWKVWYYVARLSFGMYLNHLILRWPTTTTLAFVDAAFGRDTTLAFLVGLLLTILVSAAIAAITFVLVEQPVLAWRNTKFAHA